MLLVFFKGLRENEDIVEVDDHESVQERPKEVVHEPLEGSGCIAEAKGHDKALVVAISGLESGLVDMIFEDLDLVVTALEVDLGEYLARRSRSRRSSIRGKGYLSLMVCLLSAL